MPSELGQLIRATRAKQEIGLREFARRIDKSPAFVTQLECDEDVPSVAEETLRRIAVELGLEHGKLFVLAHRTPRDLAPATETEYARYRRVKSMTQAEQRKLLTDLGERRRRP